MLKGRIIERSGNVKGNQPQLLALKFLKCFLHEDLAEEVIGDLTESYQLNSAKRSKLGTQLLLWYQVINYLRPFAIRNFNFYQRMMPSPLKNYLTTAFRYSSRNKVFTSINLAGLAIGLTVCFLALLYVNFELSYDIFHEKASRIYRVTTDMETPTGVTYHSSSGPMASALQTSFPEIEQTTRVFLDYFIVSKEHDPKSYSEVEVAYVDSTFFSVFSFPLLSGNKKTMLIDPFSIVLSQEASKRYFGNEDPIGKTLLLDGKLPALVTGVMKDIPTNSHIQPDILISMSTLLKEFSPIHETRWDLFGFYTYAVLTEISNQNQLQAKLPKFASTHSIKDEVTYRLNLEPLTEVYLKGKPRGYRSGSSTHGNENNIYLYSFIAVLVLAVACFNFVNLTTALSMHRSKEIGVRKVLGATQNQLVVQFMLDSILLCTIAFIIALGLSSLALPFFNNLAGKIITTSIFANPYPIFLFFVAALITGLLSGIYPALILAAFKPINSLKGKLIKSINGFSLQKNLVTIQFALSIFLLIATIGVYLQLRYMQTHDLGFDKENKIAIDYHFDERITLHTESVKENLLKIPGIQSASFSITIPGKANLERTTEIEDADGKMQSINVAVYNVDFDFIKQYEMQFIAGRDFSEDHRSDKNEGTIINEAAVEIMGYTNPIDALGKKIIQMGIQGTIIGVIKNFHYGSFKEEVKPLTMRIYPGWYTFLSLQLSGNNIHNTLSNLETKWQELAPGLPLVYSFTDKTYDQLYKSEERFVILFSWFAALAILISCLGLLGITSYNTTLRIKEIGIRKVMGASTTSLVKLLSGDIIKLVLFAFILATPLAWYGTSLWLQSFAYKTELPWWAFFASEGIVMAIAFFTISFQTIKAAKINPTECLKES